MSAVASSQEFMCLIDIGVRMARAGLPQDFVAQTIRGADVNEGVRELVQLWGAARSKSEKDAICADLQELLDDMAAAQGPREAPSVRPGVAHDDVDGVLAHIKRHKERLRTLIERHGGVSEVARRSGIPQPSLSRMLGSGSMPRRSTLYKIARALGVAEREVLSEYVR